MRISFTRAVLRSAVPALLVAMSGFSALPAQASSESPYRVLHTYCSKAKCADGAVGEGMLAIDPNGNLFTVANSGGAREGGTLSELTPNTSGSKYAFHRVKHFCNPGGCATGGQPMSGPILDTAGNLYGTTSNYGNRQCGTVFMATPASTTPGAAKATMHVLHAFNGYDGCNPYFGRLAYQGEESRAPYDGTSPLFGMTNAGGYKGRGVVFELTPPASGKDKWHERLLYSFCNLTNCADGQFPQGNLTMDSSGNLFGGTTDGKIFELTPANNGRYSYRVIYTSTTSEAYAQITVESNGTLIGVADAGGSANMGTLFSLSPNICRACNARDVSYQYTLLHDFCLGGLPCTDGYLPGSFVLDAVGNIFGTTFAGGANPAPPGFINYTGAGVVFRYFTSGDFAVIHNFCSEANCADGGMPLGGLTRDNALNLYGTTSAGGSTTNTDSGAGVVYQLEPR
ncbi:MAG TPA: choice-of-anchor tandem repeat GloVer-containing protein [Rhizomicrobium sp.]|nr:choice-of-anchor tandem repeat GloVer-containing protein [Rhizomicrobium sp.]